MQATIKYEDVFLTIKPDMPIRRQVAIFAKAAGLDRERAEDRLFELGLSRVKTVYMMRRKRAKAARPKKGKA